MCSTPTTSRFGAILAGRRNHRKTSSTVSANSIGGQTVVIKLRLGTTPPRNSPFEGRASPGIKVCSRRKFRNVRISASAARRSATPAHAHGAWKRPSAAPSPRPADYKKILGRLQQACVASGEKNAISAPARNLKLDPPGGKCSKVQRYVPRALLPRR